MTHRRWLLLAAMACCPVLLPATASGATTCGNSGGTLAVVFQSPPLETSLVASSSTDAISVFAGGQPVDCSGTDPTQENVDTIEVGDFSATGVLLSLWNPSSFAPGASDAGDAGPLNPDEIEIEVDLGPGDGDRLYVHGGGNQLGGIPDDRIRYGSAGVNWNVHTAPPPFNQTNDVDLTFAGVEAHRIIAGTGDDVISAGGDAGTGDPFPVPLLFPSGNLYPSGGADRFVGGDADDIIYGSDGRDTLIGGAGADELYGDRGRDMLNAKDGVKDVTIRCGKGRDEARVDNTDPNPKSC